MIRALLAILILVPACNRQDQPEAPTAEESDQLNEAEHMLDELANEEGPATEAADPSINSN